MKKLIFQKWWNFYYRLFLTSLVIILDVKNAWNHSKYEILIQKIVDGQWKSKSFKSKKKKSYVFMENERPQKQFKMWRGDGQIRSGELSWSHENPTNPMWMLIPVVFYHLYVNLVSAVFTERSQQKMDAGTDQKSVFSDQNVYQTL